MSQAQSEQDGNRQAKKRTVYKLIRKNGEKQRVKSRSVGERVVEDNLFIGLVRERQSKNPDYYGWNIEKATILKDKDGRVAEQYERMAKKSDLEVVRDE